MIYQKELLKKETIFLPTQLKEPVSIMNSEHDIREPNKTTQKTLLCMMNSENPTNRLNGAALHNKTNQNGDALLNKPLTTTIRSSQNEF